MPKAKGVPTEEKARPLTILLRCDRHLLIARRPRTDDAGRGSRAETAASSAVFIQGVYIVVACMQRDISGASKNRYQMKIEVITLIMESMMKPNLSV